MVASRRSQPCPDCGRTIVMDDGALKVSHEAPECAAFAARVRVAGSSTRTVEVLDVPPPAAPSTRRN